jgi:hypothetical protein
MAVGHIHELGRLHTGQTGPVTPIAILEDDDTTPIDLSGHAARLIFNYAGEDPHYVGQVAIDDAVNGVLLYDWTGAETTKAGQLTGRLELLDPGSIDQATQEWTSRGLQYAGKPQSFKWTVVQAA